MKRLPFIFLLSGGLFFGTTNAQTLPDSKLVILHTNDLHSHFNGYSPESEYTPFILNDDSTRGGYARIATLIREEIQKNGNKVLVLDAGDFLMGAFFPTPENSDGFFLSLMKRMGYEIVTLGNHEYDFGPQVLAGMLEQSTGSLSAPLIVASNLSFSRQDKRDDDLKALYDQGIIRPYRIIEKNGIAMGMIGILGRNASGFAPGVKPAVIKSPVKMARKYTRILKEKEKVDMVICLSHGGISKDKKGEWSGDDVMLAKKVRGIDVILSGHTHPFFNNPIIINKVPVLQTGSFGTGIGRFEMEFSQGKAKLTDSGIIPVTDALAGDPLIQELIENRKREINRQILEPLGLLYDEIIAETSFPLLWELDSLHGKSNLGFLVADAVYTYINRQIQPGTDVVIFPAGIDNIIPGETGNQSVADIYRVIPMGRGKDNVPGYPLARIYVTGRELKGIMEILYLANAGHTDSQIFFSGVKPTYDSQRGFLRKVTFLETGDPLKGYEPVKYSCRDNKLYSITTNSNVLEFMGLIKKRTMHLVNVTLKNEKGERLQSIDDAIIDADPDIPGIREVKEWMVLLWFLRQLPDTNSNGIPDIPGTYHFRPPEHAKESPLK